MCSSLCCAFCLFVLVRFCRVSVCSSLRFPQPVPTTSDFLLHQAQIRALCAPPLPRFSLLGSTFGSPFGPINDVRIFKGLRPFRRPIFFSRLLLFLFAGTLSFVLVGALSLVQSHPHHLNVEFCFVVAFGVFVASVSRCRFSSTLSSSSCC